MIKYPDMSMEINHWRINDPKWSEEKYPKWQCTEDSHWYGIYGSDYFLKMNNGERVHYSYYCKQEHFYYLYWWVSRPDIIFASYDMDEIVKFAKKLITNRHWLYSLHVYDAVTKELFVFVTDDIPRNRNEYKWDNAKRILLGDIKLDWLEEFQTIC